MRRGRRARGGMFGLSVAVTVAVALPLACSSGFLGGLSGGRLGASAPIGCDAAASFCDDFDHGPLGATWTDASLTPNGSIALVDAGISPPFAFRASYLTGTVNTTAYLTKFVGGSDTIRCELDLMIPAAPAQGEVDYLAFITNAPDNFTLYKLYFTRYDSTWNLGEYGLRVDAGKIDRSRAMQTSPPTGRWTHVVFQTTNTDHSLSISFDGAPADTLVGTEQFVTTSREVQVGIAFASNNADTSSALYDNVTCDWTL